MPYITQRARENLNSTLAPLEHKVFDQGVSEGELNYIITRLVLSWTGGQDFTSYKTYNAAIGVLECVKQELYRRAVGPYEDTRCRENGEVYNG